MKTQHTEMMMQVLRAAQQQQGEVVLFLADGTMFRGICHRCYSIRSEDGAGDFQVGSKWFSFDAYSDTERVVGVGACPEQIAVGEGTTRRKYTQTEFNDIVRLHGLWIGVCDGGVRADLHGADLRGLDMKDVKLDGADMSDTLLDRVDMRRASLDGVDLHHASATYADMRSASLVDAVMCDANLSNALLNDVVVIDTDMRWTDMRCADLSGTDLRGADLRGADYSGAYISAGTKFPTPTNADQ